MKEEYVMGKRILVADGDTRLVRSMSDALQEAEYEILTAADGNEAWRQISAGKADLIVVSEVLPLKNGYEVLEAIRADVNTRDLAVIMLFTQPGYGDVHRAMAVGLDCFITKPFRMQELLIYIKRIFRSLAEDQQPS